MNEVQFIVGLGVIVVGAVMIYKGKAGGQILLGIVTVLCGGALVLGLV
jgi:hypothetical protein